MMRFLSGLLLAASLPAAAAPPAADPLPRKAALGIAMGPPAAGQTGVVVNQVLPGLTAAKLGLQPGDAILSIGGRAVGSSPEVAAYSGTLTAGSPVALTVRRAGKVLNFNGKAVGRPLETYERAEVRYGAVPFRNGRLRDILVTPRGVARPPVLFLIQGFTCTTMEGASPDHPYRRLGQALIDAGVAFYRVEKPAVGDSVGEPRCLEMDYTNELDAFRTAYRHLAATHGFEPDRVFMLGHSLGGLQAPMLAAEQPPRGAAAYGTVLRNWADYHHDISYYQDYLFTGADPAAEAAEAEASRELVRLFYLEGVSPAEIVRRKPGAEARLRDLFNWDGGERIFGRHYRFAQELPRQPLIPAWRDARTNVLALYGESDVVALFDSDHRMIADVADFQRPGTGRYVSFPGTDHGMGVVGDRKALREKTRAAGNPPNGPFNAEIARVLIEWIRAAMAKPPVRTLQTAVQSTAEAG